MTTSFAERIAQRLTFLYGDTIADQVVSQIFDLIESKELDQKTTEERWSEKDIILITYGDTIRREGERPLQTMTKFLNRHLTGCISGVHILPFHPFSSDDGFSVIDYRKVNHELGEWEDIHKLGGHFDLMSDLVINHCSRENLWFIDYISDNGPGREFFIEMDPETDVSLVTRPRNSPLLVPVYTRRGLKYVWATFSKDQVDLNFKNPQVLLEYINILLNYIKFGSRFVRLDAIAFLWKEVGTTCIHLPETHEVVKLLRDIVDEIAPDMVLITETNVPVKENLSYFGEGDEAHMVYQFGLPPLCLHALHRGNASYLTEWAANIPELPKGCSYLNFTASHDGIGLRPAEGILPTHEVADLIDSMHRFGGFVSMKANADGVDTPYEINISLFDAFMGTRRETDQWQIQRFLCSQVIMMSLQGIPAIYIHSLTASPNDVSYVEKTGRTRSINRRIWDADELNDLLFNPATPNSDVFNELRRIMQVRRQQPAFNPNVPQHVFDLGSSFFALCRHDAETGARVYTICNVTNTQQQLSLADMEGIEAFECYRDILQAGSTYFTQEDVTLPPYKCLWLTPVE